MVPAWQLRMPLMFTTPSEHLLAFFISTDASWPPAVRHFAWSVVPFIWMS
jgi:hypothetical protein